MAQVVGSVDARNRPVVRIAGGEDELLAIIDTGFNGDMIVSASGLRTLGCSAVGPTVDIELGDGSRARVRMTRASIEWLGAHRTIQLLFAEAWQPAADEPCGLIGTRLLAPHLLLIDSGEGNITIETQG